MNTERDEMFKVMNLRLNHWRAASKAVATTTAQAQAQASSSGKQKEVKGAPA